MNRFFIFTFLTLLCTISFAQQALQRGQDIISPEIHDNNTVTFRLKAPKAAKVEITGDFLSSQVELKEGKDGVWEYTTPEPLAPELYSYSFIVNGLKITDPNNVYMIRDVASVTNVFIIGGGRADLYKVNAVPHGTVARRWYNSPTLKKERRITIYTPPGYEN
ncbi:Carbohydrate acetyl esterase/feruloyl esterase, partial [termite gut metagenome]